MTGTMASYCFIVGHCENTMAWIAQPGEDHFDAAYSFIEGLCANMVTDNTTLIEGHGENTMIWITQSGADHFGAADRLIESHCDNTLVTDNTMLIEAKSICDEHHGLIAL